MAINIKANLYLEEGEEGERDSIIADLVKRIEKFKNFDPDMKSTISYHICNHDIGEPCTDQVIVLGD